ncbi:DUF1176 domain-containing protein [Pelagibacterium sp.]|uniref:DUF1176 domain-containing protein n=1 Tax=Pelagibacterium sp. TaxID=1967288 RepID=UPI003A9149B0
MRTNKILVLTALVIAGPGIGLAQDDSLAESEAFARFTHNFADLCYGFQDSAAADYYPDERWELSWNDEYSDQPRTTTLYKFFCGSGAYNVNHVYYLDTEFNGSMPVGFAAPTFDVVRENDELEAAVIEMPITGYASQLMLTNSEFNPETKTITSHALWRGIGDAFSAGTWSFHEGQFRLVRYDVDADYDGEIDPITLVGFK